MIVDNLKTIEYKIYSPKAYFVKGIYLRKEFQIKSKIGNQNNFSLGSPIGGETDMMIQNLITFQMVTVLIYYLYLQRKLKLNISFIQALLLCTEIIKIRLSQKELR